MLTVKSYGFCREQVDGDGVAGERVDDKNIELLGWLRCQRSAGVSLDDVDLCSRVANVGKDVAGHGRDGRVDVVETDVVAGTAVGGDGPGTQADDADVAGTCGAANSA